MNEALKRKVKDLQDKIHDLSLELSRVAEEVEELTTEAYDGGFADGEEAAGDE